MTTNRSHSIARVYAEALFELAEEQQLTPVVRDQITALARLVRDHPDFAVFLETPALSRNRKIEALIRIFDDRVHPLVMDFLKVVADKQRLNLFGEIEHAYIELDDQKAGRVRGLLTTAVELAAPELNRLNEQINRALHKNATLQVRIDPAILGGFMLNIENTVVDASVQGRLDQMSGRLRRRAAQTLPRGCDLIED